MPQLFVDTSAFYALVDRTDGNHRKASRFYRRLKEEGLFLVTTNYVFGEVYTLVLRKLGHGRAVEVGENMKASSRLEIVRVAEKTEGEAWSILKRYADKGFSYVDAVSFAFMREGGLDRAFAFDEHFEQFGLETLP